MAAQLFTLPRQIAISSSFAALPGAKLYFFLSGTSTPQDTYQDADLSTPHTNPVIADANGVFDEIYLDPAISYKSELRTSADVLLYTSDPCNSAFPSSGQVNIASSVAGTNTIVAALVPAITVYTPEMTVVLTPVATTTAAVTLNLGPGALPVQYLDGSALSGAEMVIDRPSILNLNKAGTAWVLQNPAVLKSRGLEVGYRFINYQTQSGSYTILQTDNGKLVKYGGAGGHTYTFGALTDGTNVMVENTGSGNLTIAVSGGTTLSWLNGSGSVSTGSRTLAVGGTATIYLADTTFWRIVGVGLT